MAFAGRTERPWSSGDMPTGKVPVFNVGVRLSDLEISQMDDQRERATMAALLDYVSLPDETERRKAFETLQSGAAYLSSRCSQWYLGVRDISSWCGNPILPLNEDKGWEAMPVNPHTNRERLIPLGPMSPHLSDVGVNGVYFQESHDYRNFLGNPVDGALLTHFVREGLLQPLQMMADHLAPAGLYLIIYDTYRPAHVQRRLFEGQFESLRQAHSDLSESDLIAMTKTYVSLPAPDPENGTTHASPHSTGGVVDLSIGQLDESGRFLLKTLEEYRQRRAFGPNCPRWFIDTEGKILGNLERVAEELGLPVSQANDWYQRLGGSSSVLYHRMKQAIFRIYGTELFMGTPFDSFEAPSALRFFETLKDERELSESDKEALGTRRLLHKTREQIRWNDGTVDRSLQAYAHEWWEIRYGDSRWAKMSGEPAALYGPANLSDENKWHEALRIALHQTLPPLPLSSPSFARNWKGYRHMALSERRRYFHRGS